MLLVFVFISIPMMLCVKPCAMAYCCKPPHHEEEDFDKIEGAEDDADKLADEEGDSKAEMKAY